MIRVAMTIALCTFTLQSSAAIHYQIPFDRNSHASPPDCWVIKYPELSYPLGLSAREERLARARENVRRADDPDARAMHEREVETLEIKLQVSKLWRALREGDSFDSARR